MGDTERAAMKAAYPEHYFCKVIHVASAYEAVIAIPKHQRDEDHANAAALYHGSVVRLG